MSAPEEKPTDVMKSLFDAGRYEEMRDYCLRMLDDDPTDATALHNIYVALSRLRQYEDAISYCDKVLETHDPHDEHALQAKILALGSLERHDEVICICEGMLEADSQNIVALTGMSFALVQKGRYGDSVPYSDRALAVSPDNLLALLHKALALPFLERHEEALLLYDRLESVHSPQAEYVFLAKSNLFSAMGREDEAFLAAQGVRNRDMARIISDARRNNCSVFHQFCNNEYSEMHAGDGPA